MVVRVLAVPDSLALSDFDEVFRTLLGWDGLGFSFHIHIQEFTSFLRRTRALRKSLQDFQLRPRETFLYTCGGIDQWEWEFRLLDSEVGSNGDDAPVCLAGRGASPPEWGNDQHSVRGINNQPGGKPALRQAATNALDATRCAPAFADSDQGLE